MTRSTAAAGQPLDRRRLLPLRDEPRQEPDGDRERREALPERLEVLRREDGRRDEHGDLLAVLDGLERGPDRDLGLAVADVADDEAVHRPAGLHVGLRLGRPRGAGRASPRTGSSPPSRRCQGVSAAYGVAAGGGPGGVELEELLGQVVDGPLDPLLRPDPVGPAEPAELGPLAARVAADPLDLLDRDVDPVALGEAQLEVVALLAGPAAAEHLLVAGDAVVDVDDEVARGQPLEDVARDDPPHRLRPADPDGAEQLAVGDERKAVGTADEPAVQAPLDEGDRAGRRRGVDPAHGGDRTTGLAEQLRQPGGLVRGEDDPLAVLGPRLDRLDHPAGPEPGDARLAPAEQVARAAARRRRSPRTAPTPRSARASGRRAAAPSTPAAGGTPPASPSAGRRPRRGRPGARRPGATGTPPDSARSPGSSRTRSVPGPTWSSPVAGQTIAAQTSAASPASRARVAGTGTGRVAVGRTAGATPWLPAGSMPSNRARSAASRSGSRAAARPRRARSSPGPPAGTRNSLAGRSVGASRPGRRSAGRSGRTAGSSRSRRRRSSIRTGSDSPGGKTSTIPPRRANSPRPATSSVGS